MGYNKGGWKDHLNQKVQHKKEREMRGIKNSQLYDMKRQIENVPSSHQREILKILIEADCTFTENQSGVFFDIKILSKEVIHKIKKYLKFYNDTEDREYQRETEETELREELKEDPYGGDE